MNKTAGDKDKGIPKCANTSCEQNDIDTITEGIDSVSILDNKSICANCGKEGSDVMNLCNKCNQVKYCNAACKKKHRHKHNKACEEYLRVEAEKHDEKLFKQPPPEEDCPICFVRLPTLGTGKTYMSCCGKRICSGCILAPVYDNQGNKVDNQKCPFCRTPFPDSKEAMKREKKRVEMNDPIAINHRGICHRDGTCGFPQDYSKALEFFHRAGDLEAFCSIGSAYKYGQGVETDKKKAVYYYELSAMKGDADARHNVGVMEDNACNIKRALRHYMIAAGSGHTGSVGRIKTLYSKGQATKEEYTRALQLYQTYLGEIKSDQRDKAAAFDSDRFRYY